MFSLTRIKIILKILVFLTVLALVLFGLSLLFLPKSNRTLKQYSAGGYIGEPENSLDYFVLGDSNVSEGVAPLDIYNKYGYTGYVCGKPWQSISGDYYLMKEILRTQKPKLFIIETDSIYENGGKGNSSTDKYDETVSEMLEYYLPVFHYHDNWKHISDYTKKFDYRWKDNNKGHYVNLQTVPYTGSDEYMDNPDRYPYLRSATVLYLKRIQALCRKNNIELMFLSVPSASSWNEDRHNVIAKYAEENNITFIDMNYNESLADIDWDTDTRDGGMHMNYRGARKVSNALADYLQKYGLTDRRGDSAYSQWDSDLKTYNEQFDTQLKKDTN